MSIDLDDRAISGSALLARTAISRQISANRWLRRTVAIARLLTRAVGTVLVATLLVFVGVDLSIPGGFRAVALPGGMPESSPAAREIIDSLHLDSNVIVRWFHWLWDGLNGDLGRTSRGDFPVLEVITHRLPISLELMLVSVALTALIGVPLGVLSATRAERPSGLVLNTLFGLSQSIPVFLTPIALIWLFALRWQLLPAAGWTRLSTSVGGNIQTLIMPATALAFAEIGHVGRVIRADVLSVLGQDYISAAVGKGLTPNRILFRHALRPASLGLLNVFGLRVGSLLAGALVVELVFALPGLGPELFEAILIRDLYLLLGLTAYTAAVYAGLAMLVDGLMLLADPRIRKR